MRESAKPFYVVFAIAAALIVPAAITLRAVIHPVILQPTSDNPTPLGYTWSLLLFVIPIAALGWWFACRPDLQFPRKAFWRNHRRARATWFLARPTLWQCLLHFPQQGSDTRLGDTCSGWSNSNRGIRLLFHRLHARVAKLYLVR